MNILWAYIISTVSNITLKNNDVMTNPKVKLKSEQIKEESKRNLKRKR